MEELSLQARLMLETARMVCSSIVEYIVIGHSSMARMVCSSHSRVYYIVIGHSNQVYRASGSRCLEKNDCAAV